MSDERSISECKFVHDIMTPLAVALARAGRAQNALNGEADELDLMNLRRNLDSCCAALEKLSTLATERRTALSQELE